MQAETELFITKVEALIKGGHITNNQAASMCAGAGYYLMTQGANACLIEEMQQFNSHYLVQAEREAVAVTRLEVETPDNVVRIY